MKISLLPVLFISVFLLSANTVSFATNKINPDLLEKEWSAYWVTHPDESPISYGVYNLRKVISLETVPENFWVHVSADNRYKLYVNEELVCLGPSRGDLFHWRFETVDLAPYLKPGKNILAAEVWNYADLRPVAQFSYQTGFILQGDSGAEEVANTDSGWKIIKNNAYTPESGSTQDGAYIVVGPCVRIDASQYPWRWKQVDFPDQHWEQAKPLFRGKPKSFGTEIKWGLTPREIPFLELTSQRFEAIRRSEGIILQGDFLDGTSDLTIGANQTVSFLVDQGVLTTAYPELITSQGDGSEIKLTYAEALFDSNHQKGNRNIVTGKKIIGYSDYFLPDGGSDRSFKTLWFRTFRYVLVEIKTGSEPLVINDFKSQFTAYPLQEKAQFSSNDEQLKDIWEVGWRTARLCAGETYFDCPYYEQLQYVGDTRIQALISLYVAGDDRLMRKAIQLYDDSRFSEGLTMSRYPAATPQVIPPYSLFWVDMVHDYWMLRDDEAFVKDKLKGIKSVLDWFIARIDPETGLLGKVPYWNFVDWANEWQWDPERGAGGVPDGGFDGRSSILTLHLAYSAMHAAELLSYFNDNGTYYASIAKSLKQAVTEHCKEPTTGYMADTPGKTSFSQHAQIFGILTATIPKDSQKAILENVLTDPSLIQATMYFRFYLTRALQQTGLADHYLETLDLWRQMLENGLTTFAEKPDPTRSDCHAWSASPNFDLLSVVAGIQPAEKGFKKVKIQPALGNLKWIKGEMPHPLGSIKFDLKREGANGLSGFIELPENLTGTFYWNGKELDLKSTTNVHIN